MARSETDPEESAPVDFETAADIFVSIFPGATLEEVYDRAIAAALNADTLGFDHEAHVLRATAAVIRRRLLN